MQTIVSSVNEIFFTQEPIVIHNIQLFSGGELFPAEDACETMQMEHLLNGV